MKLKIETWILEKGYSSNIRKLFKESVICYRNEAYRASLLFSYIGFLTIIKETLIKSKAPAQFTEPEWSNLIARINNDETWEKEVYESLIRTSKSVFPMKDDLRLQLKYWKDRRNDCAHFKNNAIESQHTEAFWSFIMSNIPKMTVDGGKETLINLFDEHFDETLTPPDSDFTHLVRAIESSVLPTELHDFFEELSQRIEGRIWWRIDSEVLKVYHKILDIADPKIQEALINFLKTKKKDIKFLNVFPDKILQLNYSEKEIRKMWKERIFSKTFSINPFNIFAGILRSNLIPKSQINEASKEIFSHFHQVDYHKLPAEKDIETLKANDFFDAIHEVAIVEKQLKDFMWVNSKCDLLISFIENASLSLDTVKCIIDMTMSRNPSQWLVRELQNSFQDNPELKKKFHQIALANSIPIPSDLK